MKKFEVNSVLTILLVAFGLLTADINAQGNLFYYGEDTLRHYQPSDIIESQSGAIYLVGNENSSLGLFENPFTKNFVVKVDSQGDTIWTKSYNNSVNYPHIVESPTNMFHLIGTQSVNYTCQGISMTFPYPDFVTETKDASWNHVNTNVIDINCIEGYRDFTRNPDGTITALTQSEIGMQYVQGIDEFDLNGNITSIPITLSSAVECEKASNGYWTASHNTLLKHSSSGNLWWQTPLSFTAYLRDFCSVENDNLLFVYDEDSISRVTKTDSIGTIIWDQLLTMRASDVFFHSSGNYIVSGGKGDSLITLSLNPSGNTTWSMKYELIEEAVAIKSIELQNGSVATLGMSLPPWGEKHMQYVLAMDPALELNEQNDLIDARIYPNPAESIVNIKLENPSSIQKISLYSNVGELFMETSNDWLDVSSLSSGYYHLLIETDAGNRSFKLIKP